MVRRRPSERLVAWVVTGPLGHLWSVVADVAILWVRYGLARLRRRAFERDVVRGGRGRDRASG